MQRRDFVLGAAAAFLATPALAQRRVVRLPRAFAPQDVTVSRDLPAGRIYVMTEQRFMYWTLGNGRARRYGIAVGAAGRNLKGEVRVARKAEWPAWVPTRNMIRMEPEIYARYVNGLPGGHEMNPMGARALYLYRGSRDTMYRIHGTPQPWTLGRAQGSGCVRTHNEWIVDLYDRVPLGTRVWIG